MAAMPCITKLRTATYEVSTKLQSQAHVPWCCAARRFSPELGWIQSELAKRLVVSRQTVSHLLHKENAVTAEMAVRISNAVGETPDSWLSP